MNQIAPANSTIDHDQTRMKSKLLMISTDRSLFEEGSAVRARQATYAENWDEVHIVVFQLAKAAKACPDNSRTRVEISRNCFVYSTESHYRINYVHDAIRLGNDLVRKNGITHLTCQDPSLTAKVGVALKKMYSLPLEIQVHGDIGSPYFTFTFTNRIRKFLAKKYLPQADSIRVVSSRIREFLIRTWGISEDKIRIEPIRVDVEWLKEAPIIVNLHSKYPQFNKIVLMAGRLEAEKNFTLGIQAWAKVVARNVKAGLVIVGRGSEEDCLKTMVKALGLEDSVKFESWADPATLTSYYKTSDVFLNTSLFEGYGLTLVEAQTVGCRVISTDVGIARESGARIVSHDVDDVARAIIDYLN